MAKNVGAMGPFDLTSYAPSLSPTPTSATPPAPAVKSPVLVVPQANDAFTGLTPLHVELPLQFQSVTSQAPTAAALDQSAKPVRTGSDAPERSGRTQGAKVALKPGESVAQALERRYGHPVTPELVALVQAENPNATKFITLPPGRELYLKARNLQPSMIAEELEGAQFMPRRPGESWESLVARRYSVPMTTETIGIMAREIERLNGGAPGQPPPAIVAMPDLGQLEGAIARHRLGLSQGAQASGLDALLGAQSTALELRLDRSMGLGTSPAGLYGLGMSWSLALEFAADWRRPVLPQVVMNALGAGSTPTLSSAAAFPRSSEPAVDSGAAVGPGKLFRGAEAIDKLRMMAEAVIAKKPVEEQDEARRALLFSVKILRALDEQGYLNADGTVSIIALPGEDDGGVANSARLFAATLSKVMPGEDAQVVTAAFFANGAGVVTLDASGPARDADDRRSTLLTGAARSNGSRTRDGLGQENVLNVVNAVLGIVEADPDAQRNAAIHRFYRLSARYFPAAAKPKAAGKSTESTLPELEQTITAAIAKLVPKNLSEAQRAELQKGTRKLAAFINEVQASTTEVAQVVAAETRSIMRAVLSGERYRPPQKPSRR